MALLLLKILIHLLQAGTDAAYQLQVVAYWGYIQVQKVKARRVIVITSEVSIAMPQKSPSNTTVNTRIVVLVKIKK